MQLLFAFSSPSVHLRSVFFSPLLFSGVHVSKFHCKRHIPLLQQLTKGDTVARMLGLLFLFLSHSLSRFSVQSLLNSLPVPCAQQMGHNLIQLYFSFNVRQSTPHLPESKLNGTLLFFFCLSLVTCTLFSSYHLSPPSPPPSALSLWLFACYSPSHTHIHMLMHITCSPVNLWIIRVDL